jgi:hypothetical protein
MSPLLLILRKDLRLLRLPVAVWLALLAGQVAFALSPLDQATGEPHIITAWSTGSTVLTILHLASLLVLLVGSARASSWRRKRCSRWSWSSSPSRSRTA